MSANSLGMTGVRELGGGGVADALGLEEEADFVVWAPETGAEPAVTDDETGAEDTAEGAACEPKEISVFKETLPEEQPPSREVTRAAQSMPQAKRVFFIT